MLIQFKLPNIDWSPEEIQGVTDLVKDILTRARNTSVLEALNYGTVALGFDSYAFGIVANDRRPDADSQPYIMTNQAKEWVTFYDERAYMELDPRVLLAAEPGYSYWEAAQFDSNPRHKLFLKHAGNYGIRSGLVLGLCTRDPPSYAMMTLNRAAPTLVALSAEQRLLIAGQAFIIGKILSRSVREYLNQKDLLFPAPPMTLNAHEKEMLTLAASGYTSKEIAELLGIARITVDTHMKTVVSKMGALTRGQAIARAMEHKLIRPLDSGSAEYKSAKIGAVRGSPRQSTFNEEKKASAPPDSPIRARAKKK